MIAPTLTASEVEAVRSASSMRRVEYPGGSVVAVDGNRVLFATGSSESFASLWRQAEAVRGRVGA